MNPQNVVGDGSGGSPGEGGGTSGGVGSTGGGVTGDGTSGEGTSGDGTSGDGTGVGGGGMSGEGGVSGMSGDGVGGGDTSGPGTGVGSTTSGGSPKMSGIGRILLFPQAPTVRNVPRPPRIAVGESSRQNDFRPECMEPSRHGIGFLEMDGWHRDVSPTDRPSLRFQPKGGHADGSSHSRPVAGCPR